MSSWSRRSATSSGFFIATRTVPKTDRKFVVIDLAMANKRILYVGGLAEEVNEKILHSAFVVFGDVLDVNIPIDYASNAHRGFG